MSHVQDGDGRVVDVFMSYTGGSGQGGRACPPPAEVRLDRLVGSPHLGRLDLGA